MIFAKTNRSRDKATAGVVDAGEEVQDVDGTGD
jgi:hypothetical protein